MNNTSIKTFSIAIIGLIGVLPLWRYIDGYSSLDEIDLYVVLGSIVGIVFVILSDRLISLNLSKDKFEIKLSEIRREMNETLIQFKDIPTENNGQKENISKFQELVNVERVVNEPEDLIKEAEDIGKAMRMLREIITSYRNSKS